MGNNLYSNLVNFYNINDENFKEFMAEIYKEMLLAHRDVQYVKEHLTEEIEKILDIYLVDGKFNINIEEKVNEFLENNQEIKDIISKLDSIKNKTKESINVKYFGVKGDGVTDDTAILQELLDNYESLYFPPGVYIATNLKLNSFNHIHGEGRKSHLKQKANTNNHFITCKTEESHSIKITSIYIDGNRNNQNTDNDGIHIVNSLTEIEYEQLIDYYLVLDNIYVEISKKTSSETYYTNGSATVDYNNKKYYVEENSNISYDKNNQIKNINGSKEELVQNSDEVDIYEKTAIVKKDNKLAIVPKDNILLDTDGKLLKIKELDTDNLSNTFSVTNNTNEDLSYRVVIEKSDKSTLLTDYIKYQLSVDGTYIGPTWLNDTLWKKDKIYNELKVTKDNYILLDGTIKKYETKNISLILWPDYEKSPNAMQNKQFLGTIKIYAWTKVK